MTTSMPGPGIEHLVAALRDRDKTILRHSERAAHYACFMGNALGLRSAQMQSLQRGGILHDLGKLSVPQTILEKPGPLSPAEWEIIRHHPQDGHARLVGRIEEAALDIVLHHHEWYNGQGYPGHMKGETIPVLARIFSIADAFDAITSNRSCRRARPAVEARDEIVACSGTQFDPILVEVFCQVFDNVAQLPLQAEAEAYAGASVACSEPVAVRKQA